MAFYEYECPLGHVVEIERDMSDESPDEILCEVHQTMAGWKPSLFTGTYKWTPGKETGIYKHDYGLYATHDMTVPGKMAHLKALGDPRFQDPFDK